MNLSPQMEDYLEAIGELCAQESFARVSTVARKLGVSNPSVVGALRTLKQRALITQERYGYIRLTGEGALLAQAITSRHQALARFFEDVLGLDPEIASQDACRIEHVVSPETLRRLRAAADFLGGSAHEDLHWKNEFPRFYERWSEVSA